MEFLESKKEIQERCISLYLKFSKSKGNIYESFLHFVSAREYSKDSLTIPLVTSDYFNDNLGGVLNVDLFLNKLRGRKKGSLWFCTFCEIPEKCFEVTVFGKEDIPDMVDLEYAPDALIGFRDKKFYLIVGGDVDFFIGSESDFENLFECKIEHYLKEIIEDYYALPLKETSISPLAVSLHKVREYLSKKLK